mgnify:CR=1 FL=1
MCKIGWLCVVSIISFTHILLGQVEGHKIVIHPQQYEYDTIIVGNYYADRQIVHDTLVRNEGQFILKGDKKLKPGMYLAIFRPDNQFIQFMVPVDDQHFTVSVDVKDVEQPSFVGSAENDLFMDYVRFIQMQNKQASELNERLQTLDYESEEAEVIRNWLANLSKEVEYYQNNLISSHPNSLTARLIKSNIPVEVPDFEGHDEEIKAMKYHHYKKHFFDHLDLGDSVNFRMPFLHQKISQYVDQVTAQIPDSIIVSVDYVLNKMTGNTEAFRFYLSYFLNQYAKSKQVGMDGVYVHLVDNYYSKGYAPWVDQETLQKLVENSTMLRPTIIGKRAENITTSKEDGTTVSLYDIQADYTVLYIYAFDCGHCKKSTPHVVDMYNKLKHKGVKVMTICTKRELDECWKYTQESKMDGFINTVDPHNMSRFRTKFDVRTTPKIYILDKDKKILLKNFAIEKITEIMEEVIRVEESKTERNF